MFPAKGPKTEGPRLGDLSVSSSAYGMPIPIVYGTMRLAGNMIWSSGLREHKKKQKSGGKGGGGQTQTTYTYFSSFLLAFGEGPAQDVLRMWADGKLIYDKTSPSGATTRPGLKFRFHGGGEAQLPDPLLEAYVGAGRAPAHRGLCTIMFEDLALGDFGNRIPNITAEITYKRAAEQPYQVLDMITPTEGGVIDSYQIDNLAIDWQRGYGYLLRANSNPALAGIRRFNLARMREDRQARLSDVIGGLTRGFVDALFCGTDGYLYLRGSSTNHSPIFRIEPNALREVGRFGHEATFGNPLYTFPAAKFTPSFAMFLRPRNSAKSSPTCPTSLPATRRPISRRR